MAERTSRLDVAALALLACGLLVAVCVLTHDPHAAGAYPPPAKAPNLLGRPGAWLGQALFDALGLAVYLLLASWFVLVVLLVLRRGWLRWSLRLAGWLLLLPAVAMAAELIGPRGPGVPAGGSLGAYLAGWLHGRLPAWGVAPVVGLIVLVGLVLALDVVLWQSVRQTWAVLRRPLGVSWRAFRWWLRRRVHRQPADPVATTDKAPPITRTPVPVPDEEQGPAPAPALAPAPAANGRAIPIHHHQATGPGHVEAPDPRVMVRGRGTGGLQSEADRFTDYELPPLSLLEDPQPVPHDIHDQMLHDTAALLEKTFKDFSLNVRVVGINTGPVITQYELALETGLRVNKVTVLADDLALNLKVPSVRIVAPIPGKNTVGIEVPNEHRAMVRLKEVLLTAGKRVAKMRLPLFLGKDAEGKPLVYDLADMPHLLIAGRTGTGKSVCLNSIILSMLMTRRPDEVKLIMIDPKRVELADYARLPHLMHPIVTDMKKAEAILAWAVDKMEERYDLLSRARVRNIASYNELSADELVKRLAPADEEERARIPEKMPCIVIIVDELSDLMMMLKKEIETHIIRLAQKSRAAGIHLVVATQKPTVDVITGLIKSNLPARICFQVSSRTDSRVVLDEMGADKLLGKGDLMFLQPGTSTLVRAQGTYLDDREIERVVGGLQGEPCFAEELIHLKLTGAAGGNLAETLKARDELYEAAIDIVVREGRGSVSLLQRSLGIGYGRAARLIDFMAEDGIVGSYNGSNAREVLYTPDQWEEMKAGQG